MQSEVLMVERGNKIQKKRLAKKKKRDGEEIKVDGSNGSLAKGKEMLIVRLGSEEDVQHVSGSGQRWKCTKKVS